MKSIQKFVMSGLALAFLGTAILMPASADAQSRNRSQQSEDARKREEARKQREKERIDARAKAEDYRRLQEWKYNNPRTADPRTGRSTAPRYEGYGRNDPNAKRTDQWKYDSRNNNDWRNDSRRNDNRRNDNRRDDNWRNDSRRDDRDDWFNIAERTGILSNVLRALSGDNKLFFSGSRGSLYAIDDYQRDCESNDRHRRARAEYFSHAYFYRDGQRYTREEVKVDGERYYRLCRS